MSPTVSQSTPEKASDLGVPQQADCAKSAEREMIRNTDTLRSEYLAQVRRDVAAASGEVLK